MILRDAGITEYKEGMNIGNVGMGEDTIFSLLILPMKLEDLVETTLTIFL